MKILGIHQGVHDSGYCIIEDGKLKYLFEAERYFKIKHFYDDYDRFRYLKKFNHVYEHILSIDNDFDLVCVGPDYSDYHRQDEQEIFEFLFRRSGLKYREIKFFKHHQCHAAASYYTSGFDNARTITLDGGGDDGTGFVLHNAEKIKPIVEKYGDRYSKFSKIILRLLGISFEHLGQSGKFMSYASHGNYDERYKKLIELMFGHYDHFRSVKMKSPLKDLSNTFNEIWLDDVFNYIKENQYDDICFSGGCFLNILLNYRLVKSGLFKRLHFIPNTDDSGNILGAALNGLEQHIELPLYPGPKAFDSNRLNEFSQSFEMKELDLDYIVDLLLNQKVIGVFRGNMETGPRALGNRSIICDPRNKEMKDFLNQKVKHREWFRPFGLIITEEDLPRFYDIEGPFPYMNILGYNKTDLLGAVTHIDNTTRIQTVTREQNEFIYDLLKRFEQATGVPALLNTSFNVAGKPIVNWYEDAFDMLSGKRVDALIIEDKGVFSKI